MAARLERAERALAELEAALSLEEEEGDVRALVLVEHQVDTRRKQKLLLCQLRVLQRLVGVIENPGLGLPPAPTDLRKAAAEARERWQELKARYKEALGVLGEAVPPALARLDRGRQLLQRGRVALRARLEQQEELQVKLHEAKERRDKLFLEVQKRRLQRLVRKEALQRLREEAARVGASCHLYQTLAGVQVLPPSPGSPSPDLELELGPPPGPPLDQKFELGTLPGSPLNPEPELGVPTAPTDSLLSLHLSLTPGGGVRLQGSPLPLPPPLGPGLLELQWRCWEGWSLWAEVTHLRNRFALDWQPELGLLQVLGGPRGAETLWTLKVEPGYPQSGGVRLLSPPEGAPPVPLPPDPPTLTQWLELLVRPRQPDLEGSLAFKSC